ncbi:MAG TPA: hypothetical protein PLT76_00065 [Candidatus Omnitrophota bacterium]|nr:hypothetical protein [Candidatus Omnitrophota bacterium]HQO57104.1 hypothetical protein [Candidatus Omnitrophota bacterium]HQP11222.1 hypothetical protein [Candidatus Omnitrophota bacterium]
MRPPNFNMIIIAALILGFIAFARYLVIVNQDIQQQIQLAGQQR